MPRRKKKDVAQEPTRLTDWQIDGLDSIFSGFAAWYRATYDEQGRPVGKQETGLQQPRTDKETHDEPSE